VANDSVRRFGQISETSFYAVSPEAAFLLLSKMLSMSYDQIPPWGIDVLMAPLGNQLVATRIALRPEQKHGYSRAGTRSAPHRRWFARMVKCSRKRSPDRGGIHPSAIRPR
jgi:hypothetical protein